MVGTELLNQHLGEVILGVIAWFLDRTVRRFEEDLKEVQEFVHEEVPNLQTRVAVLEATSRRNTKA